MDATESPMPTYPSPPSFSLQCHFYLAVDRLQFKMDTLVDLLGMAGRRLCLPMVVCCSTRDELDAVCSNISILSSYISVSSLYSDLSEAHRAKVLDNFRQAIMRWNRLGREEEADGEAEKEEERKSYVIVVTDACLPLLGSELPVCARILINYELPKNKESDYALKGILDVLSQIQDANSHYLGEHLACREFENILRTTKKVPQCDAKFCNYVDVNALSHLKQVSEGRACCFSPSVNCAIFVESDETYMRRMAACLSADGIVITMVVGGEVVILKNIEESSGLVIAEMPIHIFEII